MAKIAISLPDEVLLEIEKERRAAGLSRSEFFRRAVEAFFRQKREAAAIEEYIQGYMNHPETREELGWVETASQGVLAEYPWDEKAEQ